MIITNYIKNPRIKAIMIIFVILFVLFCILPLVWTLMTAFKSRIDFLSTPPKFIFLPTLENFKNVFKSSDFIGSFKNSIIISICTIVTSLLFGVHVAYGLCRFKFAKKSMLAFWILSLRFAPPVIVLMPIFLIYKTVGITDTYFGMTLIYMLVNLPLVIWVMYGFIKDIPIEIEEAALMDGANPLIIFYKVVLPLVKPGLVATSILTMIFTWNEFMFALILTGPHTRTLPIAIYNFISYSEVSWGQLSASSILALIPVVVFTLIIQKSLVTGLTFGAVKE